MPSAIPESTKTSLGQRLRQRQRWPGLAGVQVRFRGRFAHVDGELDSGEVQPLCRLRHGGSTRLWGFAVDLASRDGYQDSCCCRAACRSVRPSRRWTAPAGSTWPTPAPGSRSRHAVPNDPERAA